jgi:hypothetical protein
MDSPQHHRAPHAMRSPGHVAPINLGLPLHAPDPAPGNNPFVAPAPAPVNNPFLALPAPAVYNGQQYNHLPAALAQRLAAIPPLPVSIGRGCGRGLPLHAPDPAPGNNSFVAPAPAPVNNPFLALPAPAPVPGNIPFLAPAPAPAVYNGQQYNHLPAALAQQLAAIPPLPVYIGRGRGRGLGRGHQAHPPPDVVPPPIIPPAQHGGHGRGRGQGRAPAPAAIVC